MSDEVAKLKAELEALSLQCQLARDNEIRFALQRTRLESGRMQLMLKIVDAIAPSARPVAEERSAVFPQPVPGPLGAGNGAVAAVPDCEKPLKPNGLPTVAEMVLAVLKEAGPGGLRPPQVTSAARGRWWPAMPAERAAQTMYAMAKAGRLRKHGVRYRLPDHSVGAGLQSAAPVLTPRKTAETQAGAGSSAVETLAAMRSRKAAAMRRWRGRNRERQVAEGVGANGHAG